MRTLSATLLAEQKKPSRTPYVKVEVHPTRAGVKRLFWERLYVGTEPDEPHAMAFDDLGSLHRVRRTATALLMWQKVANPGVGSLFSTWTQLRIDCGPPLTLCAYGAEVNIFFKVNGANNFLYHYYSTDYGTTWTFQDLGGLTATYTLASAKKPNGDIAVFKGGEDLRCRRRAAGVWQAEVIAPYTTQQVLGIGAYWDADAGHFKLAIAMRGPTGDANYYLYTTTYTEPNTWSSLSQIGKVPGAESLAFQRCFLDKLDVFIYSVSERYTGTVATNRLFVSQQVKDATWAEALFFEPLPFNAQLSEGLSLAHFGDYAWAEIPSGVWRAPLTTLPLELTGDIVVVQESVLGIWGESNNRVVIELDNASGKYQSPGTGSLVALKIGNEVKLSPGYRTTSNESSYSDSYYIEGWEHRLAPNERTFVINCIDAWGLLRRWTPRYQMRWNEASNQKNVYQLLEFILARIGIKLGYKSQSTIITTFYPDFTLRAGDKGTRVIRRLLGFVPDVLFFGQGKAYTKNPTPDEASSYAYGSGTTPHPILAAAYGEDTPEINHIVVQGKTGAGALLLWDVFSWDDIDKGGDRLDIEPDLNIDTEAEATDRGNALLRKQAITREKAQVVIPPNCGQELYDVIDITEPLMGYSAKKFRVLGLSLTLDKHLAQYHQRLSLASV